MNDGGSQLTVETGSGSISIQPGKPGADEPEGEILRGYAIMGRKGTSMDGLFPCLGLVGLQATIFGFLAFVRYLNYKETGSLAEKGLTRPEGKTGGGFLRWGILITDLGLALHSTRSGFLQRKITRFTSAPGCWEAPYRFFLALA